MIRNGEHADGWRRNEIVSGQGTDNYLTGAGLTNRLVNDPMHCNSRAYLRSRGTSRKANREVKSPGTGFIKTGIKRDERLIRTYSTDVNQNASHALWAYPRP